MPDLLLFPSPTRRASAVPPPPPQALSDTEARAAALDIQRSWIVEAPAGSGKTGLLIQRYLKLLAHAEIHRPGEVLVLTFTRKADAELRTRVLDQLTLASENTHRAPEASAFDRLTRDLAEAVLARDRALGWRLLDTPAQLNIRTIDSFCGELAASMPLLSGAGRLQPVDDAFPLYYQAAERTVRELGGPDIRLNDALRTLLLHRDAQVSDCTRLLADMLAQREQWSELIPLGNADLTDEFLDSIVRPRLERTLERIVTQGLQRAAAALGEENLTELAHFATRLSIEPGYRDCPNPLAGCANLGGTIPVSGDSLPHWKAAVDLLLTGEDDWRKKPTGHHLKIQLGKPDVQWLEQFIAALRHGNSHGRPDLLDALIAIRELPPARYPEEQWPVVKALCRILSRALVELRSVFGQRAQCDFTEIALTARSLLRPNAAAGSFASDPLNTPAASLSHLLVDEMQDTSAGQYQLLESITEFWDGASQTVFLVGDPKQSIYAFRQARVERFLRTVATGLLGDLPVSPLRLTANFRSQAALVEGFNQTFRAIFPTLAPEPADTQLQSEETAAVPFIEAVAVRSATTAPAFHWHASRKADAAPSGGPVSPDAEQAQHIRSIIEDFLEAWPERQQPGDDLRPPRIAVLARNRGHLAPVIAEFHTDRGRGSLPFRAVDVEALNERTEVLDLLALTRALLHPADRVAWLAVLRSPVCGLSLPDLLALTGEGPDADGEATVPHLVTTRNHHLSPEGAGLLEKTWVILQGALDTLGSTPLSTLVQRTWITLGADAPLLPEQRTNCLRFLDLLHKLETGPDPLSLPLLNRNLHKLYAQPTTDPTPIELMTIHKAKGLEWDLVLVPSLERGSGRSPHALFKWLELDNASTEGDLLLAPIAGKGTEASDLSKWLSASERCREVAEAQRLLYVACTRAREELHLFAAVETKANGSLCTPQAKASLLYAAWPAAEAILQRQIDDHRTPAQIIPFAPASRIEPLTLAAGADPEPTDSQINPAVLRRVTNLRRIPSGFDPLGRFLRPSRPILPYTPATALRQAAAFARPEGSFTARAFGNAVHRFLQLISIRLGNGDSLDSLRSQLPAWQPRLTAVLRNEGLPANTATAEAHRAVAAMLSTLADPAGAWVLGPHTLARSETLLSAVHVATGGLRADRTFLAGSTPLSSPEDTHLWIVDYKTAELGGRSTEAFLATQKQKYLSQMQAYAQAAHLAGTSLKRMVLALYFPLLPALISWPADDTDNP